MKQATRVIREKDIVRTWYLVDVGGKVLGRVAGEIALKLMGKSKPYFVRNLDCGDHVVVINAGSVTVTGHKESEKLYSNYSGYPGGLKQKTLGQLRTENPTVIVRQAVWGMLPKNKLRHRMITRLYVYSDDKHPHGNKFVVKE